MHFQNCGCLYQKTTDTTPEQIEGIRLGGVINSGVLDEGQTIHAGMTTAEIDQ